jgi:hypothetical protein
MGDTLQFIEDNWVVISQAPWVFVGLIGLFGGGGLLFGRFWQSGVVTTLESRMALRDDRIADYERKLGGATPDEASAKIAELERRLNELTHDPRLFTAEQLAQVAAALKSYVTGEIQISRDLDSMQSVKVHAQLARFFKDQGWKVTTGTVFGITNPPASGIVLLTRNANPPSADEVSVVAALNAANVKFELRHDPPHAKAAPLQLNFSDIEEP